MSGNSSLLSVIATLVITSSASSVPGADRGIDCVSGYSSEVINYFREVALKAEGGDGFATPRRWESEVRIGVSPSLSEDDVSWISQVIERLAPLIQPLKLHRVESQANLEIRSVPRGAFRRFVPGYRGNDRGLFWIDWNELGVIQSGGVLIAEEITEPGLRRHVILEELTQALGLPGDSPRYPDSIFFSDESRVTELSQMDEAVLRLLYDPSVADEQRLLGSECPDFAQSADRARNNP